MNIKKISSIAIAGIMVFAPVMAIDQQASIPYIDAGVMPDSPFYGMDLFMEKVNLAFTFSNQKRIEKLENYDLERHSEIQELINENMEEAEKTALLNKTFELREQNFKKISEAYNLDNVNGSRLTYDVREIQNRNDEPIAIQNMINERNRLYWEDDKIFREDFETNQKLEEIKEIYQEHQRDKAERLEYIESLALSEDEVIVLESIVENRTIENNDFKDHYAEAKKYLEEIKASYYESESDSEE